MMENEEKDVEQAEAQPQEVREQNSMIKSVKNPPNIGAVIIISGFFLLVADLIAATILLINGITVGAIVCAALFVGGLLLY